MASVVRTSKNARSNVTLLCLALAVWIGGSSLGCARRESPLDLVSPRSAVRDAASSAAIHYVMHPFDVPATLGSGTSCWGLNNRGDIVGNFGSLAGNVDGFAFRHGQFAVVDVAAASPDDRGTLGGVNNLGVAVGEFIVAGGTGAHLFLRSPGGRIVVLPDAFPGQLGVDAGDINDLGSIAGSVTDADGNSHGFRFHHGTYTFYDHAGAIVTRLTSVNNSGRCVGFWLDSGFHFHAFLLHNGVESPIHYPGAVSTRASDINNQGQVVGSYDDGSQTHGYLFSHGGFTTLDFPGSSDTRLLGISDQGVICGTYDGFTRGLVATPSGFNMLTAQ